MTPTRASGGHRIRIFETGIERGWEAESKTRPDVVDFVLDVLIERGMVKQSELAEDVGVQFELVEGTARGYTCAALLILREAGFIRYIGDEDRSALWELVE